MAPGLPGAILPSRRPPMSVAETIAGADPAILLLCDHASNAVPDGVDLGVAPDLMTRHITVDIGAGPLTRTLAAALGARAILATVSRLVIDLNREPDHPGIVPLTSDGHAIPGNIDADIAARIARFHVTYHQAIAAEIARQRPALIVAVHSFTPRLEDGGGDRPWVIGVLYNRDTRAARPAIDRLRARGHVTGDNEPYSGRLLNATINRHAEGNGIAYLSLELRNDQIGDAAGVARWADELAPLLAELASGLRAAP